MLEIHTLPNGLRVAVEPLPHARSVAVGVWLGAGSHYERVGEAGAAHFLEHMLFKGTSRRSGRELALSMDRIGGEFNALTGRETTCYYGWVLPENWPEALRIIGEMLLQSRFDAEDLERERSVILEEIRGDDEVAENRAMMAFDRTLWGHRHPLGRPVAGTVASVSGLERSILLRLHDELYTPDNAVVSVAGKVDPDEAVRVVEQILGHWCGKRTRNMPRPGRARTGLVVRRRRWDQVHLVLGSAGPHLGDPELYPAMMLSTLLGGGSSSRLFQAIREQAALAYTVFAFQDGHRCGGSFGVYAAVRPDGAARAVAMIREELERVATVLADDEEIHRARAQLKNNLILGLESVSDRMNRNGESLLLLGRVVPPEEVEERLETVTAAAVRAVAHRLFSAGPQVMVAMGPVDREELGLPEDR